MAVDERGGDGRPQDVSLERENARGGGVGRPAGTVTGTVTFLFTDIEGSTRLLQALGRDRYRDVLAEHGRLLREAFDQTGGQVIDTQGDAYFVAFRSAADAVTAAAAAQHALAAHEWPGEVSLAVRMGLHTGEAALADDRYLGLAVHRAARIGSAAHGGQVLLSDVTRALVEDELPSGVALRDLGEQRLKDIDRPVRVYQLEILGLPSDFPPLRTGETAFAGREGELAAEAGVALRRRRWPWLLVAAGLVVAGAVAATVVLLNRGGSGVAVAANSVAVIDPKTNKVVADITGIGQKPGEIVASKNRLWVASASAESVFEIDARTRQVVKTFGLGFAPSHLAAGGAGFLWVTSGPNGTVKPIDLWNGTEDPAIPLPGVRGGTPSADGVAASAGRVWVYDSREGALFQINPQTGVARAVRSVTVGSDLATPIAARGMVLWFLCCRNLAPQVVRLDLRGGSSRSHALPVPPPLDLAVGDRWVWVTMNGHLARFDRDGRLNGDNRGLGPASVPVAVAIGAGGVWLADAGEQNVVRVDAGSNGIIKRIELGGHTPAGVVTGDGLVWVTVGS